MKNYLKAAREVLKVVAIVGIFCGAIGLVLRACTRELNTIDNYNRAFAECMNKMADQRPAPQHWLAARECNAIVPESGRGIHVVKELGL